MCSLILFSFATTQAPPMPLELYKKKKKNKKNIKKQKGFYIFSKTSFKAAYLFLSNKIQGKKHVKMGEYLWQDTEAWKLHFGRITL
jgi:hypothetical protein